MVDYTGLTKKAQGGGGDVVLDNVKVAFTDEDTILDHIYQVQIFTMKTYFMIR